MALHALDDVDDAYRITRAFLTGIDRTTWLKLALVVFFVGGAGANFTGTNASVGDAGTDPGTPPVDDFPPFDLGPEFWLFAAVAVVALIAFALAFLFVAAVMEFVFVESLRTEVVSIREYWSRYWRDGVHLFAFRLAIGLFGLVAFLLLGTLFFGPLVFDSAALGVSMLLGLFLVPVFFVLALLLAFVDSFTVNFVVPIMILENRGVLDGWRRLWPTIRSQWKQYLAYAVVAFVLSLVAGVVVFVVTAILVAFLFIPFGVLFAVGIGLFLAFAPVGIVWLVLTGLLFGLAALAVAALVQVPVQTYLRYYALLVLGDVEETFDVIPEQRASTRSEIDESP